MNEVQRRTILKKDILLVTSIYNVATKSTSIATTYRITEIVYRTSEGLWIKFMSFDNYIERRKEKELESVINEKSDTNDEMVLIIGKEGILNFLNTLKNIIAKEKGNARLENVRFFLPSGFSQSSIEFLNEITGLNYTKKEEVPAEYNNCTCSGWDTANERRILFFDLIQTEYKREEAFKNIKKFFENEGAKNLLNIINQLKDSGKLKRLSPDDEEKLDPIRIAMGYFGWESYGNYIIRKAPKTNPTKITIAVSIKGMRDLIEIIVNLVK